MGCGCYGFSCLLILLCVASTASARPVEHARPDLAARRSTTRAAPAATARAATARRRPRVGFDKPSTFPDFTDCATTTPELDVDWKATIAQGGRGRGFSRIMPSFAEALTAAADRRGHRLPARRSAAIAAGRAAS